jgi:glycosyltransferase involved in cell wall biosynthesis
MKIAIYAIAKNEAVNVPGWLQTVSGADYIVVADTGSNDGTVDLLACDPRVNLHHISITPWRFDDARNAALALVPSDVDVCIALDFDERLPTNWREIIESAWLPGTTIAYYPYTWRHNPDQTFFNNHHVHCRHGYRWRHPTHECLYPVFDLSVKTITIEKLHIEQFQDCAKVRPNDLFLLAWGQWEDSTSTRMLHYYGRELMFCGYYAEAIERFKRYLELEPSRPFPAERELTLSYLAQCHGALTSVFGDSKCS